MGIAPGFTIVATNKVFYNLYLVNGIYDRVSFNGNSEENFCDIKVSGEYP